MYTPDLFVYTPGMKKMSIRELRRTLGAASFQERVEVTSYGEVVGYLLPVHDSPHKGVVQQKIDYLIDKVDSLRGQPSASLPEAPQPHAEAVFLCENPYRKCRQIATQRVKVVVDFEPKEFRLCPSCAAEARRSAP